LLYGRNAFGAAGGDYRANVAKVISKKILPFPNRVAVAALVQQPAVWCEQVTEGFFV